MAFLLASLEQGGGPTPPDVTVDDFTIVVRGDRLIAFATSAIVPIDGGAGRIPQAGTYLSTIHNLTPGHTYEVWVDWGITTVTQTADAGGTLALRLTTTAPDAWLHVERVL